MLTEGNPSVFLLLKNCQLNRNPSVPPPLPLRILSVTPKFVPLPTLNWVTWTTARLGSFSLPTAHNF